jgi:fibronectin-binding autotransporter adhesin
MHGFFLLGQRFLVIRSILAAVAVFFAVAGSAQAQTTTWTGVDSSWNNPGNWSAGVPGSGAPLPNGIARFSGTATNTTATLGGGTSNVLTGLEFANSAAAYTLTNGTLAFANNGFIDLLSSAGTNTQTIAMTVQFDGNGNLVNSVAGATLNLAAVSTTAGGTLTVDTTGTTGISGVVGGGALFKDGTGTLTLSGSNTYTGATTISGGVLSVATLANGGLNSNIGASSNAAGNLVLDGGTLRYTGAGSVSTDRAFTLNAGGGTIEVSASATTTLVISGSGIGAGRLTKAGIGILTLTGTNIYTGGTTVSAGTLRIGNGVISGSVTGNILNNAILQFNNPSTTSFSGDITGTGTLNHLATGILTLLGTNSNSGSTTVNSGTLQIGNGGTTGSITSNVALTASTSTLAFNRADSLTSPAPSPAPAV